MKAIFEIVVAVQARSHYSLEVLPLTRQDQSCQVKISPCINAITCMLRIKYVPSGEQRHEDSYYGVDCY
jgi:hypothetical protein